MAEAIKIINKSTMYTFYSCYVEMHIIGMCTCVIAYMRGQAKARINQRARLDKSHP